MISHKITVATEFTEKSTLDITEFIENLPMNYEKYARYTYRIRFNHNLYLES